MATRNERRRRAKAKAALLREAVAEAFKAEAERPSKPEPLQVTSRPWCTAGLQRVTERTGMVQARAGKRKLITREVAISEPLKIDGLNGMGTRRKTWLTGQAKRYK